MSQRAERRGATRRPVLESFSLFVVIPKKGSIRLPIHDVSDHGMLFDWDVEGELAERSPIAKGEDLEIQFYLNQTLYLPIEVRVARLDDKHPVRKIGVEIKDNLSQGCKAFRAFLQMLDALSEEGRLATSAK